MTLPGRGAPVHAGIPPAAAGASVALPAVRFDSGSWRALRRLVERALPTPAGALAAAVEAVEPSLNLPVAGRRPSPVPRSNEADGQRSPSKTSAPAPEEIDAEHEEVWSLVRAAQGGDGDAFGQLYDRYVDAIFRFIYYRVNDRQLAEDFTSETFLRALRRITTISYQGRDIGAWFMTIARNIVFDHSKSARFRLELTTGEPIEGSMVGNDHAESPESAVLSYLTNQQLLTAVNSLNDEQKECIVLRFLNGLSVAETAEVMGKNDGAIKALQHRAVKRLAALVADDLR